MSDNFLQTLVRFVFRSLVGLMVTAVAGVVVYLLVAYHFSYSKGESVGFVQKLS